MRASLCDNRNRKRVSLRARGAVLAVLWGLLQPLCLPQAWAQRRSSEPEANPQFQQDVQGSGQNTGQPIDNQGADSEPAPAPAANPALPGRAIPDVEIGASPEERPAASPSGNPLDIRVSVRVKDAPLAVFLETISAQAKVNFLISEDVQEKRVTAFLQNVSVRDALQMLLEIKGLTYEQIGKSNTYIIAPRTKAAVVRITRIFTLSYIPLIGTNMQHQGTNTTSTTNTNGIGASSSSLGTTGQTNAATGSVQGANIANASVDNGSYIINIIKSILSKDGQVAVDPRTNSLVITDIPDVFPQIEQIISELDKKTPQVMIEAQIVEIDSDKTANLGLEWGAADGTLASYQGGERDTAFPLALSNNLSQTRFFGPITNVISGLGSSGTTGSTTNSSSITGQTLGSVNSNLLLGSNLQTGIVNLTSLTVVLRALIQRTEARFLGKPKVMTMNNRPAIIEISQDQAVAVVTTLTSGVGGGFSQSTVQPERAQTGLKLEVIPQVNKDGYISMLVQPDFTNVTPSVVTSSANPIYDTLKRTSQSLVRVKNGQTLVLAGLLSSQEQKVVRKVPLLGYIPIIGWFFTSNEDTRNNTDLVIFITPTIVND